MSKGSTAVLSGGLKRSTFGGAQDWCVSVLQDELAKCKVEQPCRFTKDVPHSAFAFSLTSSFLCK